MLFSFNVFSFLRSVWDLFSALVLLHLWVILTLMLVLLVPYATLVYVFSKSSFMFSRWIWFVFQIINLFELSLLYDTFGFYVIVFDGFYNALVFFTFYYVFKCVHVSLMLPSVLAMVLTQLATMSSLMLERRFFKFEYHVLTNSWSQLPTVG